MYVCIYITYVNINLNQSKYMTATLNETGVYRVLPNTRLDLDSDLDQFFN